MKTFVLLAMLFLHVLDDFCLQAAVLNKLKCRSWWTENAPDPGYSRDYVAALCAHGYSWAFLTMLPLAVYLVVSGADCPGLFAAAVLANAALHAAIDDAKANRRKLNLIQDQLMHVIQILLTHTAFAYALKF